MKISYLLLSLAAYALLAQNSHASVYCVFDSSDSDGDGWGWENNRSCQVTEDSVAPDPIPDETVTANGRNVPLCSSPDADADGDGWGWEFNNSCLVEPVEIESNSSNVNEPPICSSANVDSDGDGWGWENNRSCIVEEVVVLQDPVVNLPVLETPFMADAVVDESAAITNNFGSCYSGQVGLQVENVIGVNEMIVTTDLTLDPTIPEITCAAHAATRQYTYKWQDNSWNVCTESDWEFLSLNDNDTQDLSFGIILNIFEPGLACGSGYYVNHSTFCAQYLEGGEWTCEDLTSRWEMF